MSTIGPPFPRGYPGTRHPAYPKCRSITHLLTRGCFFKTSAIILLAGGSLFQPEKNREIRHLEQHLKLKSSHAPSRFTKNIRAYWLQQCAWRSRDMGMQLRGRGYGATKVHGHHGHRGRSRNMP